MLGEKYKSVNFGVKTSGTKLERPNQSETDLVERLLNRNVEQFRGGLVFKAHRLVYYSTLGSRVEKKKEDPKPQTRDPKPEPSRSGGGWPRFCQRCATTERTRGCKSR
jgi:hypothetical protein